MAKAKTKIRRLRQVEASGIKVSFTTGTHPDVDPFICIEAVDGNRITHHWPTPAGARKLAAALLAMADRMEPAKTRNGNRLYTHVTSDGRKIKVTVPEN